tara:strand:- start:188 stop:412 length:225 start_codon:yes stop_codon:yes gene_type:complete
MTYTGKANPNATNSELDAKVIIKHYQLSLSEQEAEFLELILHNYEYEEDERKLVDSLEYKFNNLRSNNSVLGGL